MASTPYAVVRAFNLFPRTFTEAWLACLLVLTEGNISLLSLQFVKTAYITAISTAIVYALCCILVKRMTLLTSIFLTGAITTFADLINHTAQGQSWHLQAFITGATAAALTLIFDRVIATIRSN